MGTHQEQCEAVAFEPGTPPNHQQLCCESCFSRPESSSHVAVLIFPAPWDRTILVVSAASIVNISTFQFSIVLCYLFCCICSCYLEWNQSEVLMESAVLLSYTAKLPLWAWQATGSSHILQLPRTETMWQLVNISSFLPPQQSCRRSIQDKGNRQSHQFLSLPTRSCFHDEDLVKTASEQ